MADIHLENIQKSFGPVEVIKGVDLEIADKEFIVFVGPSGCGKSTMLRLIAGLEEASAGKIVIGGADVTALGAAERGLSMVFQSYALYPHKTVRENMGFPLKVTRKSRTEIDDAVRQAADILQLGPLLDRRPKELSGGQRQRVAIGRSIVRDPKVFLFDEPLSNLDAALRVQMRVEIARLHRQLDATMIYVTHDQVEAMTLANRIVVFSAGRIEQIGPPLELYRNPANLFVATFLGSPKMNIMPCRPDGDGANLHLPNGVLLHTERSVSTGAPVSCGVRPEHLDIMEKAEGGDGDGDGDGDTPSTRGIIGVAEHLGGDTFLYVDVPEVGTLIARAPGESEWREGQEVTVRPRPEHIHLFDSNEHALTTLPR